MGDVEGLRGRWSSDLRALATAGAFEEAGCATTDARGTLLRLCEEIALYAARANLVSRSDLPDLVSKHVAASLGVLAVRPPRPGEAWVDVGSGAGFPGLVIKACEPHLKMVLVESVRRRAIFLERASAVLGMSGLWVVEERAEVLTTASLRRTVGSGGSPHSEDFAFPAVVTARAVAKLPKLLEMIDGISSSGTQLLTHKGRDWAEDVGAASDTMLARGWRLLGVLRPSWSPSTILRLQRA